MVNHSHKPQCLYSYIQLIHKDYGRKENISADRILEIYMSEEF